MKRNMLPIVVANILFWSTITFFTPLTIFLNNRIEFPSTLVVILIQTIVITIVCTIVGSLLSSLFPAKRHALVIGILLALSILVWIQSNLIVVDLGVFDGKTISWDQYSLFGLADLALWILFLILAIKYSSFFKKYIFTLASALIIIQILSTGITLLYSPPDPEFKNYSIDETNKFTFSIKGNVIVIVLDTFQTNYFNQVIKAHPQFIEQLSGFTYFPNATGGFNSTYPSIPLILTGQYYDNSKPIQEFIKEAFKQSSLPKFLKSEGFKNDFYPLAFQTIPLSPELTENLLNAWVDSNMLVDTNKLASLGYLTWFRIAPQYLKPNISQVEWSAANSTYRQPKFETINFLNDLKNNIQIADIQEQFKFYHLLGLHSPLTTNELLQRKAMTYTPQNYARAALGTVRMIKEMVDTLKVAGVYNNSTIVIVGDHGVGMPIDEKPVTGEVSEHIRATGQPLILVKPANSVERMAVIETPVTLGDIYKSVASTVNQNSEEEVPGLDIFTTNIPANRERHYFYYDWANAIWSTSQSYLPPMRKYIISGDAADIISWHDTRYIYEGGSVSSFQANYELGANIDFTSEQSALYKVSGWSMSEDTGTWSLGDKAILELDKLPTNKALMLDLDLSPFQEQQVEVLLNNYPLGTIAVTNNTHHKLLLPPTILKGSRDRITFNISAPISPLELGNSEDPRKLGILVRSMTISEPPQYTLNDAIHFAADNFNASQWMLSGWSSPEADGTWTLGNTATLLINTPELNKEDLKQLKLKAVIQPLAKAPELTQQVVEVSINNNVIGSWKVDLSQEYSMVIPTDILSSSLLQITFGIPRATSPASLGMNADTRQLGVLFKEFTIESQ